MQKKLFGTIQISKDLFSNKLNVVAICMSIPTILFPGKNKLPEANK